MSVLRKLHNNTNLILKTAQCMIYQVLSLFYLLLFPPSAENRCSLASVAVFTRESENFPAFSHVTFHYASITCCCILSGVQLLSSIKLSLLASSPWPRRQSAPESLLAVESRNKQQSILLIDCISVSAQALIYPLTVASKSASSARKNAANQILKNMCEHSHQLVQQAVMVGSFSCFFALCCI